MKFKLKLKNVIKNFIGKLKLNPPCTISYKTGGKEIEQNIRNTHHE